MSLLLDILILLFNTADLISDLSLKAAALTNLGISSLFLGNYDESERFYLEALLVDSIAGDTAGMSYDLNNLANLFMYQSDYATSTFYYNRSLELAIKTGDQTQIAICYNNIGNNYMYQDDCETALNYIQKSLSISEYIAEPDNYSNLLVSLGNIYERLDNYPMAVKCFNSAIDIAINNGNNLILSQCYSGLGIVVEKQGNFYGAIDFYEKAIVEFDKVNDYRGISYCLNNIGVALIQVRDFETAKQKFIQSMQIKEDIEDLTGVSNCLFNLGTIELYLINLDLAESYFEQSLEISTSLGEMQGISKCLNNLGAIMMFRDENYKAIELFEAALEIDRNAGSSQIISNYAFTLAQAYIKVGKVDDAVPILKSSVSNSIEMLRNNFSILSESEKEMYLNNTQKVFNCFNEFVLNYGNRYPELIEISLNNEILMDGLLLNSSLAMNSSIKTGANDSLKKMYQELKSIRKEITLIASGNSIMNSQDLEILETKAAKLERELSESSAEFSDYLSLFYPDWRIIKNELKKDEAIIEYLLINHNYNPFRLTETDSLTYAAIIIKSGDAVPEIVNVCNGKSLDFISSAQFTSDSSAIGNLYRGVIIRQTNYSYEIPDLYELIWMPVENSLKSIRTIYYSPCGVLNKVSFDAISLGGKQFLSSKYNLKRVSGSKQIPDYNTEIKFRSAMVFGGISYDRDKFYNDAICLFYNDNRICDELKNGELCAGSWNYLDGTAIEANSIIQILNKKGVVNFIYAGANASEDELKRISSGLVPDILHISTHGFSVSENNPQYAVFNNSFVKNSNPLYRSGLLFAGANCTWDGIEAVSGTEDGILTAAEVSLLDLSGTELVVLSACETGLGEVKGNEGVYGFQRAFKMAGVDYLILSLWQVPDKETQEFMVMFYKYLTKAKSVDEAFTKTVKKMQKIYPPFCWAAFVLIK
jgi:CHAT domain-containing protein/Tfp pilus assembly protein PilF